MRIGWRQIRVAVLSVVIAAVALVFVAWYLEPFDAVDGSIGPGVIDAED